MGLLKRNSVGLLCTLSYTGDARWASIIMGIGIRIYIVEDDNSLKRVPLNRFERIYRVSKGSVQTVAVPAESVKVCPCWSCPRCT